MAKTSSRIVTCYSGVLPNVPHYRHLLVVAHLRPTANDKGLEPFRVSAQSTHELWLWYQYRRPVGNKILLFRCQFDAGSVLLTEAEKELPYRRFVARRLANDRMDDCARFVARMLVKWLLKSDEFGALRQKDSDWFWSMLVERAATKCDLDGEQTKWQ